MTTAPETPVEEPPFPEILRRFDCSVNEDFTLDVRMSTGFPRGRFLPVSYSVLSSLNIIKDDREFCIVNSDTSSAVKEMVSSRNVSSVKIKPSLINLRLLLESMAIAGNAPAHLIRQTTGQFHSRAARTFLGTQKGLYKKMVKTLQFGLLVSALMISLLIMYV